MVETGHIDPVRWHVGQRLLRVVFDDVHRHGDGDDLLLQLGAQLSVEIDGEIAAPPPAL